MAGDVTSRLAEGLGALDNSQTYVQACVVRGFHHGDLTAHSRQLHDWYGTEDGLDLTVLDADLAVLNAIAAGCSQAWESVRAGAVVLDGAWSGESGGAAIAFVARHGTAAATVVNAVESAGRAVQRLRDELWRVVDEKVRVTLSVDDLSAAQRSAWLSAARAVLAGDTEDAAAVVDSQIRPHVEAVIAGEWLTAMRRGVAAAAEAYRVAVDALSSHSTVRFEIPGDFGPRTVLRAVPAVPVAASGPAGAPTMPATPTVPAAAGPSPAVTPAGPADSLAAAPAAMPAAPMSLPDPVAAMGGLPGQVADALGGLLGGGSGMGGAGLPETGSIEPPTLPEPDEPPDDEEPVDEAEPEESEEDPVESGEPDEPEESDETDAADEPAAPEESEPLAPAADPEPAPTPVPEPVPLAEPVPEPVPAADPETPCEIAADELPQVGE